MYRLAHSVPSLQSSSPDDLLGALLSCDVVVYHIAEAEEQVDEASWVVQGTPQ